MQIQINLLQIYTNCSLTAAAAAASVVLYFNKINVALIRNQTYHIEK